MKFSEFVDVFVAALYNETQLTGRTSFQIKDILKTYGLTFNPSWRETLFKDYTFSSRVDASRRHLGPIIDQHISLSPDGLRWVEDELGENVASYLEQHGVMHEPQHVKPLPEGLVEITGGRTFFAQGSVLPPQPREGDVIFRDEVDAIVIPASDRLVQLDHNSAPYREVSQGLADLFEELRSSNDLPCSTAERDRLLLSVSAARKLWEATELKVIQIKVGIIITIEDTIDLLSKAGKAVGKALLIDLVKSIVKHKTGIDL